PPAAVRLGIGPSNAIPQPTHGSARNPPSWPAAGLRSPQSYSRLSETAGGRKGIAPGLRAAALGGSPVRSLRDRACGPHQEPAPAKKRVGAAVWAGQCLGGT